MERQSMPISPRWLQGAILTYIVGFSILGVLAYLVYQRQPPIPGQVVSAGGEVLFTREDIMEGMNVFQRYGLMEYGSVYGHGAYLGPDFTAEYLHKTAEILLRRYESDLQGRVPAPSRVAAELHENTFDPETDTVIWSETRASAHRMMENHYQSVFYNKDSQGGAQALWIADRKQIRQLTAFFAWTAWTGTTNRPGESSSYTNNWPPEPLAGNTVTPEAVTWSVISIIGLFGGTGLVLFCFGKYDWLGWSEAPRQVWLRPVDEVALAPAQRAVVWFLVVTSVLFFLQTLCGGLVAHFRAEPGNFFGFDISRILPYNIARTWHVQLSIFWVSASYLATGIFLVPLIAGRERRGQAPLTIALLLALVVVVFGSLAGEYASIKGWLNKGWFWFGDQGWEYLDLGRVWQILLVIGLFLWVFILYRGLKGKLREQHHGTMPWLLFYAALTIPAFYAVGLLTSPERGFVITDFWRFWVVHLWVEDFLELFTTVMVAYMFVLMGTVREKTAIRVIYLDVILYSLGGVVGTMHHLYFSGTPAVHMALGAAFSALEVVPLVLLTLEAWGFMRSGEQSMVGKDHIHRWAVWFLVAVGVWNFVGAGIFGFLVNLPVVSYYEIGTNLTANHAHTAMMGVYGMLAIGLLLFCLRYLMQPAKWSDRAAKISFWSLNLGLTWMAFFNLFPIGIVQLNDAVSRGYWHARSLNFVMTKWVHVLEWARLPGDAIFILGGALPLCWLCWRAIRYPNPGRSTPETELPVPLFTYEAGPSNRV
ncbi:MAG: cbb3-type cytochrome c oxidase subunit I [Acidobacteriia bacterium]|nr:cbb3-type cytochrome c oxidase subunit I [Terriglobia bacterium]